MVTKYKLLESGGVKNLETGAFIPNDPGNIDWQKYQEWLSEGNTPELTETPEEEQVRLEREAIVEAKQFLNETDWKILRYLEDKHFGRETWISDEEAAEIASQRQAKRDFL